MIKKLRIRLGCEIPDDLHRTIWKIARRRNITLTRYVTRALTRYILDEQKYERNDNDKKNDSK